MKKSKMPRTTFVADDGESQKAITTYRAEVGRSLAELDSDFPIQPSSIIVKIFSKDQDFSSAYGSATTPVWIVAAIPSSSTDTVLINHPRILRRKKDERGRIITHELSHLYINLLNNKLPDWLKEGIAVYSARQIYTLVVSESSWSYITKHGEPFQKLSWEQAANHHGYVAAGLFVRQLVRQFGWQKFLDSILLRPNRKYTLSAILQRLGVSKKTFINAFQIDHVKKDGARV